MKLNINIKMMSCSVLLVMSGGCFAAEAYKTYQDEITCGKMVLTVTSTCMKGEDDESLNACKQQSLKINKSEFSRTVKLPELNKKQIAFIKRSKGTIGDLFAIKMGCAVIENMHYAVIYYSVGGGSAPYSEAWSIYDEQGRLLNRPLFPLYGEKFEQIYKNMKKIQSIMPE